MDNLFQEKESFCTMKRSSLSTDGSMECGIIGFVVLGIVIISAIADGCTSPIDTDNPDTHGRP